MERQRSDEEVTAIGCALLPAAGNDAITSQIPDVGGSLYPRQTSAGQIARVLLGQYRHGEVRHH